MRIKAAIIIALVVGVILTANRLIGNQTLGPIQLKKVTKNCLACHDGIPDYRTEFRVHNKHVSFHCSRCHGDNGSLHAADSFHTGLKWFSIGATAVALIGIIMNIVIINRKG